MKLNEQGGGRSDLSRKGYDKNILCKILKE